MHLRGARRLPAEHDNNVQPTEPKEARRQEHCIPSAPCRAEPPIRVSPPLSTQQL